MLSILEPHWPHTIQLAGWHPHFPRQTAEKEENALAIESD
jgi:hypothetical protein